MTPRRISALLQIKARRQMAERADLMQAMRVAISDSEGKVYQRMIKKLLDEGQ